MKNLRTAAMLFATLLLAFTTQTASAQTETKTWNGSDGIARITTGLDNGYETSGYWYVETDAVEGGESQVILDAPSWESDGHLPDAHVAGYGCISGTIVLNKGMSTYLPYVKLCFDIVGKEGGQYGLQTGDASSWNGLLINYECDAAPSIELGLSDLDVAIGYANPSVTLPKADKGSWIEFIPWSTFEQPSWYKGTYKISGSEAAQILATVRITVMAEPGTYRFKIYAVGPYTGSVVNNVATISAGGEYWSSYYNGSVNMKADENTTVYKASLDGTTVTLTEIADKVINAGQGVLLKKTTADAVKLTSQNEASTADYSDNILEGSTVKAEKSSEFDYYVLSYENSQLAFSKYAGEELNDHEAFIKLSGSSSELLDIAGMTTGINTLTTTSEGNNNFYDLLGRRMANPTKGLNIVKGKIIMK